MHTTSAVTSLDLGDCYDRVSHSIASISYQAFGVPTPMTSMMTFYLRIGFDKSREKKPMEVLTKIVSWVSVKEAVVLLQVSQASVL